MSFHPQTPQSPSRFSPNTSSDPLSGPPTVASIGTTTNSFHNTAHSGSFSSAATSSTLPTPAHSVNGSGLGPADMAPHGMGVATDSPNKRKRLLGDTGAHDAKKVHMEGQQKLDFEALHQDVGEKYLICRTPHRPAYPPLSEDLFSLFDLTGIAAEVARTLPNGEKNAMRKTYKGYMKRLGVSGHFEPIKREDGDDSGFLRLLDEAEDSWQARQVKTKDIRDGLADDVEANLRLAMAMNRGPVPKAVFDGAVLGDLAPERLVSRARSTSIRGTAPNTPIHPGVAGTAVGRPGKTFGAAAATTTTTTTTTAAAQAPRAGLSGVSTPTTAGGVDVLRPRRANKKRSYGDNSFEGYGEGFPDDDAGYSTGEGDGPSLKRRKKNATPTPTSQYSAAPVRQQSYGPGMVGA